jgi:hypothetical protein
VRAEKGDSHNLREVELPLMALMTTCCCRSFSGEKRVRVRCDEAMSSTSDEKPNPGLPGLDPTLII